MRRSRDRTRASDRREQPYERPEQARSTEIVTARHRSLGHRSLGISVINQRQKKTSFCCGVVMTVLDQVSGRRICGQICLGCPICEVEQDLRDGHRARYYPTSATQRALGRELTKRVPKRGKTHSASFCGCTDGCSSTCACCTDGIGCWWESWLDGESGKEDGWGCGCGGACKSVLPAHVYDGSEGSKARQAKLQGFCD